jgi:hypothetical protein
MSESSTNVPEGPPEHVFGDYLEIIYLFLVIIIGTPLNVRIFINLMMQLRTIPVNNVKVDRKSFSNFIFLFQRSFILLKLNLNISDLLLIVVQALGKSIWITTYEWKLGEFMCRIFSFMKMATLYLSSNIIVSIAFDRLRTLLAANELRKKSQVTINFNLLIKPFRMSQHAGSLLWHGFWLSFSQPLN